MYIYWPPAIRKQLRYIGNFCSMFSAVKHEVCNHLMLGLSYALYCWKPTACRTKQTLAVSNRQLCSHGSYKRHRRVLVLPARWLSKRGRSLGYNNQGKLFGTRHGRNYCRLWALPELVAACYPRGSTADAPLRCTYFATFGTAESGFHRILHDRVTSTIDR